jgi:hypothetical protein
VRQFTGPGSLIPAWRLDRAMSKSRAAVTAKHLPDH